MIKMSRMLWGWAAGGLPGLQRVTAGWPAASEPSRHAYTVYSDYNITAGWLGNSMLPNTGYLAQVVTNRVGTHFRY